MRYESDEHRRWYRRGAAWGAGAAWSAVFVGCCAALVLIVGAALAAFVSGLTGSMPITIIVSVLPSLALMGIADCMRRKHDSVELPPEMRDENA